MNNYRTITLTDGSEWACNRDGEGVFSRRADGCWQQHAGTGQAGPFRHPGALSRHVRANYRTSDGGELPPVRRGAASGWPS